MKLQSGVRKRMRQESALKRRIKDVEFYNNYVVKKPDKIVKRKLGIAKREVMTLQQKLGL